MLRWVLSLADAVPDGCDPGWMRSLADAIPGGCGPWRMRSLADAIPGGCDPGWMRFRVDAIPGIGMRLFLLDQQELPVCAGIPGLKPVDIETA